MKAVQFLSHLRSLDVTLWVEGDRLHYSAPDGAVTPALRAELAERKTEILTFLRQAQMAVNNTAPPILPVARDGELPLSFAQQRLWFIDQFTPGSSFYNISQVIRLAGSLNVPALEQTLNEITRRHEILRTTFATVDGRPIQVIAPALTLALPVVDLGELPGDEQEAEAGRLAAAEAGRPFDLTRGPLLRATLLRLAPRHHIVLFTMHHIISDGWSMGVLVQEVVGHYEAFSNGRPAPLAELPIQYADFAHWQREWLLGEVLEQQLSYWKQQLEGSPPVLALPTDRPRPAIRTSHGRVQSIVLPEELSKALKELSRQEECTLFMTLLAGFKALLYRYTGQEDILVGTAVANRNRAEIEPLIGFFINQLVLRTDLGGNPGFRGLLSRVREVTLGAYAHQDLPFEKLVGELQPERDPGHSPLFQVAFQLQNARRQEAFEVPGLTLSSLEVASETAKFDLTLSMVDGADQVSGSLEYNTDLFHDATISRMLGHFRTLLEGIVANPDRRLSDLPLLTEAAARQLLVEWNNTEADYPREQCIHHLIEAQARRTPDAVAITFEEARLTYRELNRRANQLAHHLRRLGAGPEVMVGVCVERSPEMIVGLLGVLKAGGAYVPMDPTYPPERLAFVLEDTRMPVLLTQQRLVASLPDTRARVICLDTLDTDDTDWGRISSEWEENPSGKAAPENLAYVIYTSGSTGRPKGALLQHRGLCNFATAQVRDRGVGEGSRVLQFASFSFDASVMEIFTALLAGARLCLLSQETRLSASDLVKLLREQEVTMAILPPSLLAVLPSQGLPALRTIISAGESCSAEIVARWAPGRRFLNGYGPTEATVGPIWYEVEDAAKAGPNIPIGRPIANMQVYLLDANRQPVPIGVPGELYIGGVGLARGYLNRPDLTAEKFIPHPFSQSPGARLYRTGDLARYLPDGNLEFLGRTDHQVKIRGFRIELAEIESALVGHPLVVDAVVTANQEKNRIIAYYTLRATEVDKPSPNELGTYLRKHLPDYMTPSVFIALEAMPLLPNGKVDRRALPLPDQFQSGPEKTFVAPRTRREELLAEIFSQVLEIEQVGVHDSFFELGGDSIRSIQVIAKASQAGFHLTPTQLFRNPTVAGLAAADGVAPRLPAEQGIVTGEVPLTPIQRWFFEQQLIDPHHWNWAFLREAPRTLDASLLEQTIRHLLRHHDALRLRFQPTESGWRQFNADVDEAVPLTVIDLSLMTREEQTAAMEAAATALQGSLNLSEGPLLRLAYFVLGREQANRVLLIFHHLAVDMVSSHTLMEDFQTVFGQLSRGEAVRLPAKTTSFQAWSRRLAEHAQSPAPRQELAYWVEALKGEVAALPVDYPAGDNSEASVEKVMASLSAAQTRAALQEIPAAVGAQMQEVLLTALVRTFARWTGVPGLLVEVEGHGREDILEGVDLSRTVGWFTSTYPVLLNLPVMPVMENAAGPVEALRSITAQLRRIPNRGIGYGLLRYLCEERDVRERMRALPRAEVNFNYLGQLDQRLSEATPFRMAGENKGPERSLRGQRTYPLYVVGSVRGGVLRMHWNYSANLHRQSTIEHLALSFNEELRCLIEHCLSPEAGGCATVDSGG